MGTTCLGDGMRCKSAVVTDKFTQAQVYECLGFAN